MAARRGGASPGPTGRTSAGILLHPRRDRALEVLLVHPGGPFFARRDLGAWTLPKGLIEPGEDPLDAARREFEEETSFPAPAGPALALGEVVQKGGKRVLAWALEGDLDAESVRSSTFAVEHPRGSGRWRRFPEVDRAAWFALAEARDRILPAQAAFLDRLAALLGG